MLDTTSRTGLFLVSYDIGTGLMGAPALHIGMTVNTVDKAVNGTGRVTQAVNPPLDVRSQLHGSYTYMTVMPDRTSTLVVVTGYPPIVWPPGGGIGPVILPNLNLRMVLDGNWQGGTANFSYVAPSGQWVDIENAKVTLASNVGAGGGKIHTLYGPAITQAAASGDLARMKQVAADAEAHLSNAEEVRSALTALKGEIAKAGSR